MRLRVLLPLFCFGLIAVIAILVPIGESIAHSRTQQLQLQRAASIDQILQRAQAALETGERSSLVAYLDRFADTYGEGVIVVDAAGGVIATVGGIEVDDDVRALVLAASRGGPQWSPSTVYPWSDDRELVAESLATASDATAGAVVLEIDRSAAKADVAGAWMLVGAVGATLLAALLGASLAWTRWVLRPVRSLDAAANALAEQRGFAPTGGAGPPELRQLSASFERMAAGVEAALEQQHGLVADASHQLRNPLAAVRLRMDALPRDGGPITLETDELEAIDRDLDRLDRTVERMLTLADAEHRATAQESGQGGGFASAPPAAFVTSAASLVAPHLAALAEAGLAVETAGDDVRVACRDGDLEEIVETLLDNARKYAGRGTTVRVEVVHEHETVTVTVSDSGAGLSDDDLAHVGSRFWRAARHSALPGTGLGHAIVEQLARANRGAVEVDRAPEGGLRTRLRFEAA